MSDLPSLLDDVCDEHGIPGAVALVARGEAVEVASTGRRAVDGAPMTRDTVFRIASLTKPIIAAAAMVLVDRGRLGLDDPVADLLPELAAPSVLVDVRGPVDDPDNRVPAERPITLRDLLTFGAGHGLPAEYDAPVVARLVEELAQGPLQPATMPEPEEWMRRLAGLPLLHQPGRGWTYNTGADVLGVLLARAGGAPLGDVLAETVLEPCGMTDTGFWTEDTERLATYYRRDGSELVLADPPDGQWAAPPPFASGAGGLLSTVDDLWAFGRMLLAGGEHRTGRQLRRVLAAESVRLMTTAHVVDPHPFLDGQGWGFGGGVDVTRDHPWNVPGRYGWVGSSGTAAYVVPATGTVVVWLSQVQLGGAAETAAMAEVLTYAAGASGSQG
ncbi:MAG TPA: serine hydrolase domain-containing protein [Nocardioides sp.]|nr:serine hydrolase domain-containing protein [Nocardioides sp.]